MIKKLQGLSAKNRQEIVATIAQFVYSFNHFFTHLFLCEFCAFAVHDFIEVSPR